MLAGREYLIIETIGKEDSIIRPTKDLFRGFLGYEYDGHSGHDVIPSPISKIHIKEVISEGEYDSFTSMLKKLLPSGMFPLGEDE